MENRVVESQVTTLIFKLRGIFSNWKSLQPILRKYGILKNDLDYILHELD